MYIAPVWIYHEFNGGNFVAQQYDKECPTGLNATSDFGFTKTASAPSTLEYKGHSYSLSEYQTWMRLDLTQGVSNTLKSSVSLNNDCSPWVSRENNTFGILNFGLGPRFFEILADTNRPENPDAERIPVSRSLNPCWRKTYLTQMSTISPTTSCSMGTVPYPSSSA